MTLPRPSTVIFWLLAAFFALGLISATGNALGDTFPTHWRFILWWLALLGCHLARLPLVPLIWLAFVFDAFAGFMLLMYAAQPSDGFGALLMASPLIILALTVFIWWRGHYHRMGGNPHDDILT